MNRISKCGIMASLLMLIAFSLTGCGDSNPLIGKWKTSDKVAGAVLGAQMEFTPKEIIVRQSLHGGESRNPAYYRMEGNTVLISSDNKQWQAVRMPDKDTLIFDLGFSTVTYKRQ